MGRQWGHSRKWMGWKAGDPGSACGLVTNYIRTAGKMLPFSGVKFCQLEDEGVGLDDLHAL